MDEPVVSTAAEVAALPFGAALVLEPLREFLDAAGLGEGSLDATAIGDGHSNLSFLLRRGDYRCVLRRPPRGELAASTNNVLREARILEALAGTRVPVPTVLATCEDPEVIGAPFFVMTFVAGAPVNDRLPADLDVAGAPRTITDAVVGALVDLHAADLQTTGLAAFGRPSGYLDRQLRRFGALLEQNATRPLPTLERLGEWLVRNRPASPQATFVHGDFRLGNLMFAAPLHLAAVLDWEMATVGDPLADLGYCTAMWSEEGDVWNPMFALSAVTASPGFPRRTELAAAYADATGRPIDDLRWYQVLALWKASIFLEGSYQRHLAGASGDAYFTSLGAGVPALADAASALIGRL
jgi:aminoglycoside phosphotransferase (APT) family kinase protein